jgi:hypothetical protein
MLPILQFKEPLHPVKQADSLPACRLYQPACQHGAVNRDAEKNSLKQPSKTPRNEEEPTRKTGCMIAARGFLLIARPPGMIWQSGTMLGGWPP